MAFLPQINDISKYKIKSQPIRPTSWVTTKMCLNDHKQIWIHPNMYSQNLTSYRVHHIHITGYELTLGIDFLIDGQISLFCPDQHEAKFLTLIMLHKLTQSLKF